MLETIIEWYDAAVPWLYLATVIGFLVFMFITYKLWESYEDLCACKDRIIENLWKLVEDRQSVIKNQDTLIELKDVIIHDLRKAVIDLDTDGKYAHLVKGFKEEDDDND